MAENNEGMLSPYRVLDLTDERGFFSAKLLGDLGADVIKIEKPEGDPGRRFGPFFHDIPDPEKSLFWMGLNTNKRGITLNIETAGGQAIFKKLCKTADIVIESFGPGYMEKLGLGYKALEKINPRLIMASISGFGQSGPYRDYKAPSIVLWALSGQGFVTGESDRPPLSPSYPIPYFFGAMQADIGAMIALYARGTSGHGQYIEVPTLLSLAWAVGSDPQGLWLNDKTIVMRSGRYWPRPQPRPDGTVEYVNVPLTYPCKDGGVKFFPFVEEGMLPSTNGMTQWAIEEGFGNEAAKTVDWRTLNWQTVPQKTVDEVTGCFERLYMAHTKAELFAEAQKRGVQLYPVFTAEDMLNFPQLSIRKYWEKLAHPELGTEITYPGAFTQLGEGSCRIRRKAPRIGEHNEEVYIKEMGMSKKDLSLLKQAGDI
jgi:crotonobetainyl-CoA:carnitine CoA-transferase CaiB-like acyl-CoA transferase